MTMRLHRTPQALTTSPAAKLAAEILAPRTAAAKAATEAVTPLKANLDKATWIPSRYLGEEYDGRPYLRGGLPGGMPGEIMVNGSGRRFANENLNYNDIGRPMTYFDPHVYEYVNHPAFAIGDRTAKERISVYDKDMKPGAEGPCELDRREQWLAAGRLIIKVDGKQDVLIHVNLAQNPVF